MTHDEFLRAFIDTEHKISVKCETVEEREHICELLEENGIPRNPESKENYIRNPASKMYMYPGIDSNGKTFCLWAHASSFSSVISYKEAVEVLSSPDDEDGVLLEGFDDELASLMGVAYR